VLHAPFRNEPADRQHNGCFQQYSKCRAQPGCHNERTQGAQDKPDQENDGEIDRAGPEGRGPSYPTR
jgi:hypothetical protein